MPNIEDHTPAAKTNPGKYRSHPNPITDGNSVWPYTLSEDDLKKYFPQGKNSTPTEAGNVPIRYA